jgi:hypothetical protein
MERKPRDGEPDSVEFGDLRAALARLGLKPEEVNAAAGTGVKGRRREDLARGVRDWLGGQRGVA